jgi:hypothetical protein
MYTTKAARVISVPKPVSELSIRSNTIRESKMKVPTVILKMLRTVLVDIDFIVLIINDYT